MSRAGWGRVRLLGGVAILVILLWRVGAGAFLDGLRTVDARALLVATVVSAAVTVCCAWRWALVSRGIGVPLSLGPAVACYYRSQLLNTMLPGGVLGDVHRGLTHGTDAGHPGRGLRAVGWERLAGQVLQLIVALGVLLVLPSPLRSAVPLALGVVTLGVLVCVLLGRRPVRGTGTRSSRVRRLVGSDVRRGLLARRVWPGVLVASVGAVVGHVAIFLLAARTAGVTAPTPQLLPLALIVLLAMAVPANVAGWGPREGVAAWAFAAAGLGAGQGIAVAVVYGVLVFVASLPGVVVLLAAVRRGATRSLEVVTPGG